MKLYIKKLKLTDKDGNTVLTIRNEEAIKGLTYALKITKDKVGISPTWKEKLEALDKEFKEYFLID